MDSSFFEIFYVLLIWVTLTSCQLVGAGAEAATFGAIKGGVGASCCVNWERIVLSCCVTKWYLLLR